MESKRMQSMDLLKFFAIFLVLWGHSIQYFISGEYVEKEVYRHIYSFHMPLFMMISGFFFAMTCRKGFIKMVSKKFRQLILPSICWILMFCFVYFIPYDFSISFVKQSLEGMLWFLKSAFICCLIGYVPFVLMRDKMLMGGGITLILSQLIPQMCVSFMYPCFFFGGLIFYNLNFFTKHIKIILVISGIGFIAGNCFLDSPMYARLIESFNSIKYLLNDKGMSFYEITLLRAYRLSMGMCGAVFFIAIFQLFFTTPSKLRIIKGAAGYGKMTLGIYIVQTFVLEIFLARLLNFDGLDFVTFNFVVAPLISVAVIFVSVFIIRLIQRIPFASFLLLGTPYNKQSQKD